MSEFTSQDEVRTRKPDGGGAFPRMKFTNGHPDHMTQGMTVRDFFAAQLAQALIVAGRAYNPKNVAEDAYRFADAMLAERLQVPEHGPVPAFTPPSDAAPS